MLACCSVLVIVTVNVDVDVVSRFIKDDTEENEDERKEMEKNEKRIEAPWST